MAIQPFKKHDKEGNTIFFNNEEEGVILKPKKGKVNKIGTFRRCSNGFLVYHKPGMTESIHIMRMNKSWGINDMVFSKLPDNSYIIIESDKKSYGISVKKARECGHYLDPKQFHQKGLEKQWFIPIGNFNIYDVKFLSKVLEKNNG